MPRKDVIINGFLERVNAILMTALTSALGMLPLAIASGPGGVDIISLLSEFGLKGDRWF